MPLSQLRPYHNIRHCDDPWVSWWSVYDLPEQLALQSHNSECVLKGLDGVEQSLHQADVASIREPVNSPSLVTNMNSVLREDFWQQAGKGGVCTSLCPSFSGVGHDIPCNPFTLVSSILAVCDWRKLWTIQIFEVKDNKPSWCQRQYIYYKIVTMS